MRRSRAPAAWSRGAGFESPVPGLADGWGPSAGCGPNGTMADMSSFTLSGLHHVQLAIPAGSEDLARRFYGDSLGMVELEKPAVLAARGGCWFRGGGWEVHLGVETDFRPARKAHPGVLVAGIDDLAGHLSDAGVSVEWDDDFPGHRRFYAHDPYGNRLEFLEPHSSPTSP